MTLWLAFRSRPPAVSRPGPSPMSIGRQGSARRAEPKWDSRALVLTYRFRHPGPMGFLLLRCLFRELAPLECSQLHHIADRESARQTSQSIALRRVAEAFFTRIHVQPQ
jgi:hypothetical protein